MLNGIPRKVSPDLDFSWVRYTQPVLSELLHVTMQKRLYHDLYGPLHFDLRDFHPPAWALLLLPNFTAEGIVVRHLSYGLGI